ncbi:uncharacterized protein [Watersipora subatra]|uniref:uncharacterized protein n=1 Tax=Watersipora subatra TaxID=2589382 RepID=UPI00355B181C
MDDPRIEWIRNQAYLALAITEPEVFEQLLDRDDGEGERNIAKFINDTPSDDAASLLFYKVVKEEEEEMEVECEPEIPDIADETENKDAGETVPNAEAETAPVVGSPRTDDKGSPTGAVNVNNGVSENLNFE